MNDLLPGWSSGRLDSLASDVRDQGTQLDAGIVTQQKQAVDIADIKSIQQQQGADLNAIKATLQGMASAEVAELRRRADFPRRLFYAIGAPVLASSLTAGLLAIIGVIHLG